jgi:hypothetical protein
MMTMTDLNETLKTMKEHADFEGRIPHNEFRALLSAVQNVLALCEEFDNPALTNKFGPWVPVAYVRKALTDALGSEPSNTGSERMKAMPEIVVLCGSTHFYDEFQEANYDLTMQGKIVLSVGFYPHSKAKHGHGEGVGHDSAEKVALDELHKRKIDLADRVLVINVGGYIGPSTRSEIDYAIEHGKPVDYLEADDDAQQV